MLLISNKHIEVCTHSLNVLTVDMKILSSPSASTSIPSDNQCHSIAPFLIEHGREVYDREYSILFLIQTKIIPKIQAKLPDI